MLCVISIISGPPWRKISQANALLVTCQISYRCDPSLFLMHHQLNQVLGAKQIQNCNWAKTRKADLLLRKPIVSSSLDLTDTCQSSNHSTFWLRKKAFGFQKIQCTAEKAQVNLHERAGIFTYGLEIFWLHVWFTCITWNNKTVSRTTWDLQVISSAVSLQ